MEEGERRAIPSSHYKARNEYCRRRRKQQAESDHPADRARREIRLAKQRERTRMKRAAETPQEREARLAAVRKYYHARKRPKLQARKRSKLAASEVAVQRGGDASAECMDRLTDQSIRSSQCVSATNRFNRVLPYGNSSDVWPLCSGPPEVNEHKPTKQRSLLRSLLLKDVSLPLQTRSTETSRDASIADCEPERHYVWRKGVRLRILEMPDVIETRAVDRTKAVDETGAVDGTKELTVPSGPLTTLPPDATCGDIKDDTPPPNSPPPLLSLVMESASIKEEPSSPTTTLHTVMERVDIKVEPSSPTAILPLVMECADIKEEPSSPTAMLHSEHLGTNDKGQQPFFHA
ncbi:uncharacterized protein LOC119404865 [Rhipicephalus sanguineus]|uniref:uncharacterized protein LOC119404865 n=1 Tax=Rhipicephalus sanguineus TaxID=34632 RepID=UPI0018956C3D|nr:uncharacterized protein LOC119404865 [Rhipicephalus sanguineus]